MARTARPGWHEQPGHLIVRRAFQLAAAAGVQCRPVHLLAALAQRDDAIGAALRPVRPTPSPSAVRGRGATASYLSGQLQGAAAEFAAQRREPMDAPHLLIAVLDQGDPEALQLLTDAGIDPSAIRRLALNLLDAPSDLTPIAMPPLTPAGTMDRPALPLQELDRRAWSVLAWRQEHLPVRRIRRIWHAEALASLEQHTAWRIADRLHLDDDQRYSLISQHGQQVDRRIAQVLPDYTDRYRSAHADGLIRMRKLRRHRRRLPRFMIGWPTWSSNRRANIRNRWFALTTQSAYRGQPPA